MRLSAITALEEGDVLVYRRDSEEEAGAHATAGLPARDGFVIFVTGHAAPIIWQISAVY